MQQVVDQAGLPWLETPDQAVVWGTALGLQDEIEDVLQRIAGGRARHAVRWPSSTYFPAWYRTSDGSSCASGLASGSGGCIFSGSAVPGPGRHDVGARDDRELPGVVGRQRWRRVQRRFVGRWWRRAPAAASSLRPQMPNSHPTGVEPLDLDRGPRPRPPGLGGHPEPLGLARDALRRERPRAVLLVPERRARPPLEAALSRKAADSANCAPEAVERERKHGRAHLLAEAPTLVRAGRARNPVSTVRWIGELRGAATDCVPIGSPVQLDHQVQLPVARASSSRGTTSDAARTRARTSGLGARDQAMPNGISSGGWIPARARSMKARGPRRSAAEHEALARGCAVRTAARRARAASAWRRSRRPWAADGTLRPWVLSRRWKTSSRS